MDHPGLANIFDEDDDISQQQAQNSLSSSDLDPFLLQGDEQTWAVEDWNWDPFNMFAAPKEIPPVACCQAVLKRPKVATAAGTATMAAEDVTSAQSCHHGCHLPAQQPPAAAAAACCSLPANNFGVHEMQPVRMEMCATSNMAPLHAAGMAPAIAAGGAAAAAMGMGMAWGGMHDFSGSSGGSSMPFFPAAGGQFTGGPGMAQAMMWGAQAMNHMAAMAPMAMHNASASAAMPGLHGFAGAAMQQQQCAPSVAVPPYGLPSHGGPFMRQASTALPSPGLGTSADTAMSLPHDGSDGKASGNSSHQGAPCCGGPQGRGIKRNESCHQAPLGVQQPPAKSARRAAPAAPIADMAALESDVDVSGSEDEAEGVRPSNAAAVAAAMHGDVVTLHDGGDDMVCQVPGCGKDLAGLKEYHQRYRICDVHIKLQQVMKDGRLQRFCQQCGRFHDLTAFDGSRKSCRDQLSKHNARRRRRAQADQTKGGKGSCDGSLAGLPLEGDVGKLLATLMQNPMQLHALRLLLGVPTHPALPTPAGSAPGLPGAVNDGDSNDGAEGGAANARTYALARDMLAFRGEFAPSFESEHRTVRMSMKLFNKTPADLPQDMRNQVTSWLASAPTALEASIRPGCVFLTVQMLLEEETAKQAAAPGALTDFVDYLLTRTGCAFWHHGCYTVQLNGDMVMVRDGRPSGVAMSGVASGCAGDGRFPSVVRLGPMAVRSGAPMTIKLVGHNLDAPDCQVVLRYGGFHVKAPLQPLSTHRAVVTLPPLPESFCGTAWLEVTRGAYLSAAKPLLVSRDAALVEEINQMDVRRGPIRGETADCLVVDLGLVLQHIAGVRSTATMLPHASIALKARRLLATACDMGWAAVATAVLPLACAQCSCASEIVAAIHSSTAPAAEGAEAKGAASLSLLHRAVRSRNLPLLSGMLAWGDAHGYRWRVDAPGVGGVTPLHLCALLDDARPALLLLDHCGWPAAFTQLRSADGVTPFHLAFQMGHYQVDWLMCMLSTDQGHPLHVVDANGQANNSAGSVAIKQEHICCGTGPMRRSRCGTSGEDDEDAGGASPELDPCEVCQCTLPPLLLSIMASCNDCGRRRHCLETPAKAGSCSCGNARPTLKHERGEICSLAQHSTVFSITALCQGCHGNRVLAVA